MWRTRMAFGARHEMLCGWSLVVCAVTGAWRSRCAATTGHHVPDQAVLRLPLCRRGGQQGGLSSPGQPAAQLLFVVAAQLPARRPCLVDSGAGGCHGIRGAFRAAEESQQVRNAIPPFPVPRLPSLSHVRLPRVLEHAGAPRPSRLNAADAGGAGAWVTLCTIPVHIPAADLSQAPASLSLGRRSRAWGRWTLLKRYHGWAASAATWHGSGWEHVKGQNN